MTPLTAGGEIVASSASELPRRLGFWATTGVVVGTIIGSGIFRMPAAVATEVGSPAVVWVLGGVISLCGSAASVVS